MDMDMDMDMIWSCTINSYEIQEILWRVWIVLVNEKS